MKTCSKCGETKDTNCFIRQKDKKDGLTSQCKICRNESNKNYENHNKQKIAARKRIYYENNRDRLSVQKKEYLSRPEVKKIKKEYAIKNKDKISARMKHYARDRSKIDPEFKLRVGVSSIIGRVLKRKGSSKYGNSIMNYLPYTIEQLKEHLRSQFEPWMSWNNWGRYNHKTWKDDNTLTWFWQIDHIIPQSKLPYTNMEDENFKKCWALENLRPLSAKENYKKRDKII